MASLEIVDERSVENGVMAESTGFLDRASIGVRGTRLAPPTPRANPPTPCFNQIEGRVFVGADHSASQTRVNALMLSARWAAARG